MTGFSPNTYIGSYLLEKLISQSRTTEVWKAKSQNIPVALKILKPEFQSNSRLREAFRKEAEIMQKLRCPQSIRFFEFSFSNTQLPYVVMEYLEGEDLEKFLKKDKKFPMSNALMVAVEILKALSEMHQQNIIHRDIKPSNIFITKTPSNKIAIKLIDFGLALHLQDQEREHKEKDKELIGTYLYMSPEQAEHKALSTRSDLYALGVVLYQLITGETPHKTNQAEILINFKQPIMSMLEKRPDLDIPPALDQLVLKCLSLEEKDRPEHADAVRRALEVIHIEVKRNQQKQQDELLGAEQMPSHAPQASNESNHFSLQPQYYQSQTPQDQPSYQSNKISSTSHLSSAPYSNTPYSKTPYSNTPYQTQSIQTTQSDYTNEPKAHDSKNQSVINPYELAHYMSNRPQLANDWAQAINEQNEFSRISTHYLKNVIRRYLDSLISVAAGKNSPIAFYQLFENLIQNIQISPQSQELIPVLTLSLLRIAIKERMPIDWTQAQRDQVLNDFYQYSYQMLSAFVEFIKNKFQDDAVQLLQKFFMFSTEYIMISTKNGVVTFSHPKMKEILGDSDETTSGKVIPLIFQGFQPANYFQNLPLSDYMICEKSQPKGIASKIKINPFPLTSSGDQMLLIDVLEEKIALSDPNLKILNYEQFNAQDLPWQMTKEIPKVQLDAVRNQYQQMQNEYENEHVHAYV
jgi:serine/threonine protein kinase